MHTGNPYNLQFREFPPRKYAFWLNLVLRAPQQEPRKSWKDKKMPSRYPSEPSIKFRGCHDLVHNKHLQKTCKGQGHAQTKL